MKYLIGLDIGTSSVKGVLMTENGRVEKTSHGAFHYTALENGGLEIDADSFAAVCIGAIRELAKSAKGTVKGVCASSASGNLVVLDRENRPVTPIFNWQDKRVTTEAQEILGEMDLDAFYKQIGWPFSYKTFPLALLCYVKKHEPEKIQNCGMACMSTEYLYYKLTGKWGISTSAGTTFYLIDQKTGTYIPELLEKIGITEEQLPPIMPCGTVLGGITEEMAEESGLPAGTPVVLGTFDHPSAARAVGVLEEGQMLLSCGTSWVGFFPVNSREKIERAKTLIDPFLSPKGGCWATMTSVASVSARIKLYVERYIDDSKDAYKIFAELAAQSELGAGGLTINIKDEPNDAELLRYPKKHIARAIMESTVRLLKERLDRMAAMGISAKSAIMVGGPSENPMWLSVIKEICGIEAKVVHGANAGAVGAAILAGMGEGLYKDEYHAKEILKNS